MRIKKPVYFLFLFVWGGFLYGCNVDKKEQSVGIPKSFNVNDVEVIDKGYVTFSWQASEGAKSYTVCRKAEHLPNQCEAIESTSSENVELKVSIPGVVNQVDENFFILAVGSKGVTRSNEITLNTLALNSLTHYIKSSNAGNEDFFGHAVSLSSNGKTLAVAADLEDSSANGLNGDGTNDDSPNSGAVYLFRQDHSEWVQTDYIKASNAESGDFFGSSISISADGNTLAVGAAFESSSSRGINGIENDNRERHSGAVYLFRYDGLTWKQQAYLKASNGQAEDYFGIAVSLSSDGNTLAVGADYEDGSLSDGVEDSGAVYIFQYDGAEWNQQAYLKASNAGRYDYFGYQISLSGDGKTLAVGVESEASNSTGINGNEADNSLTKAGAVYLFREENSNWEQLAYIKASNTHIHENFGSSVSISADGNTLAVGAESEDSSSIGIGGDELNSDAVNSGAVFLYHYNGSNWSQQAYIKPSNTNSWDFFGGALSLSANGGVLAVGARGESSSAIGINGDETVNNADSSGAVYLFRYEDSKWKQHAYIKAPNNDAYDAFGSAVGLSADGNILTVSAPEESSLATMINGDEANNNGHNVGAVYLY